jgi:hypothetical protein
MKRRERALRRLGLRYGYRLGHTRRHWRLRHPSGATVIASKTPSSAHALRLAEGDLRRRALPLI